MLLAPAPIQWIGWIVGWLRDENGLAILGGLEIRATLSNNNIDAASRVFLVVQVTTSNAFLGHKRIRPPAIIGRLLASDFAISRYIDNLLVGHDEAFPTAKMLVSRAAEGSARVSIVAGTAQGRTKEIVVAMGEINEIKNQGTRSRPDPVVRYRGALSHFGCSFGWVERVKE